MGEDSDGVFTVSKAYRKLCTLDSAKGWAGWSSIWKLKVQQRVRTFLWLLSHGKLLSNHNHCRRMTVDSPSC